MACPRPRVTRTGELECTHCGLTWGMEDPEPDCEVLDMPGQSNRDKRRVKRQRTKEIADRALEHIRATLRKRDGTDGQDTPD